GVGLFTLDAQGSATALAPDAGTNWLVFSDGGPDLDVLNSLGRAHFGEPNGVDDAWTAHVVTSPVDGTFAAQAEALLFSRGQPAQVVVSPAEAVASESACDFEGVRF